jgi:2-desacetyl-2-hydroxyethyl bacteriochlorophyllide A dehydrogenase
VSKQRSLKDRLRTPVRRVLELAGVPPGVRPHLQDRLARGITARVRALPRLGRIWVGTEIVWMRPGTVVTGVAELPAPGPGQVLVRADYTAVSPGTERAFLNFVPGVSATFPLRPGYSGSGTVLAAGRGVPLHAGQRVACTTMPHASIALLPAERVFALDDRVDLEAGAFLELAIIAQQGVRKGRVEPGSRVSVIGAGLVGLLAAQVARAAGASVTVVAASGTKREAALAAGAERFVALDRPGLDISALASQVVIEATGSPEALALAAEAATPGGRIVLLGSTRGLNTAVDFDTLLRRKELALIGAHISTVPHGAGAGPEVPYEREAAEALALLATGSIDPRPIVRDRVNPLEAAIFYRRLCQGDGDIVGAVFDWRAVPGRERARRSFAFVPPSDLMRAGRPFDMNDGPPSVLRRPRALPPLLSAQELLPPAGGPLRFALIGCGGMGVRHAGAIRGAPNATLVATMDTNLALARELAGDGFYTTRLEELLARPDVDAVFIATPNHTHDVIGIAAARAGKHVIVEKPMARNLAAADQLLRACREAGVALSVGYSFRYAPEIQAARRLIEQGVLGRLLSVQLTMYLDKPSSYWGSGYMGRTHSTWRTKFEQSGGGMLVMNMSHQLEQIRYLIGKDVSRVNAVSGVLDSPPGVEVEDVISVACEFEDGAIGNFLGSCSTRGLENLIEIRLVGDAGTIMLEQPSRFYTLRALDGVAPGRWHDLGPLPKVDVNLSYIAWFADAVLQGRRPDLSGEDGRAIQAWIEAIYESARLKCAVPLRRIDDERRQLAS